MSTLYDTIKEQADAYKTFENAGNVFVRLKKFFTHTQRSDAFVDSLNDTLRDNTFPTQQHSIAVVTNASRSTTVAKYDANADELLLVKEETASVFTVDMGFCQRVGYDLYDLKKGKVLRLWRGSEAPFINDCVHMNERDITEQEKAEKLAILYSIVNGTYQAPADKILDIATPHTKYPFFS